MIIMTGAAGLMMISAGAAGLMMICAGAAGLLVIPAGAAGLRMAGLGNAAAMLLGGTGVNYVQNVANAFIEVNIGRENSGGKRESRRYRQ